MSSKFAIVMAGKRASELMPLLVEIDPPEGWGDAIDDLYLRLKHLSDKCKEIEATWQT